MGKEVAGNGGVEDERPTKKPASGAPVVKLAPAPEIEPESTHFGRYLLGYRLAAGGMASVYLGRMVSTGGFFKPVVVKRMHPHLTEKDDYVAMFRDEAQITARISHANVCPLVDFGQIDGKWFMALEYFDGLPMSRVVGHTVRDHKRVESEEWHGIVGKIVADAAEGLHAAHELADDRGLPLGVVHRDVSPQNIMVGADGTVRVIDFGVATSRGRLHETAPGVLKGKFAYMAPEQLFDRQTDRRADVWALGVCLWEGLTGRRLFKGKDLKTIATNIKEGPIPRPSRLTPSVSAELDSVTLKALSRDPQTRFQTARELSSALRAAFPAASHVDAGERIAGWLRDCCAKDLERNRRLVRELADREDMEASTVIDDSLSESGAYTAGSVEAALGAKSPPKIDKGSVSRNEIAGAPSLPPLPQRSASGKDSPSEEEVVSLLVDADQLTLPVLVRAAAYWMTKRRVAFALITSALVVGIMLGVGWCSESDEAIEAEGAGASDVAPTSPEGAEALRDQAPAIAPVEETAAPSEAADSNAREPEAGEGEEAPGDLGEPGGAGADEANAGSPGVAPETGTRRPRRVPPRRRRRAVDRPPANPF